jgi:hypothetical protein
MDVVAIVIFQDSLHTHRHTKDCAEGLSGSQGPRVLERFVAFCGFRHNSDTFRNNQPQVAMRTNNTVWRTTASGDTPLISTAK